MRATGDGSHQFHRPSSCIVAGTSNARITVASKTMPAASPIANCLMSGPGPVESVKKANINTSEALVTSLPVRARPCATACCVLPVSSYSSLILVSMNTS